MTDQFLDTAPIYAFHVLHTRVRGKIQLPQDIVELISEYVCKALCEKDPDFATEYVSRIFTPGEHHSSYSKQQSGQVKVYSLSHIVYYNSKAKSWEATPSVKKLKQRKELDNLLKELC
jgi:hypothetical protein